MTRAITQHGWYVSAKQIVDGTVFVISLQIYRGLRISLV
jgi:hypothetical protein